MKQQGARILGKKFIYPKKKGKKCEECGKMLHSKQNKSGLCSDCINQRYKKRNKMTTKTDELPP